jgi:formate/nitrite transporter FocA (FNT family)
MFSADEIFHRVAATADHEFQRTPRMLWFSGLAAGLSIGVSFLARMSLGSATGQPGELLGDLLFPVGFLIVVLGRYQLFTENTLTPITLVLTRIASLPALLRLWGVVFAANVLGAGIAAGLLSVPGALPTEVVEAGRTISAHAFEVPIRDLFLRGVLAGGIVASMVWLIHAVDDSAARVLIVYALMLMIPVTGLFHCITSFSEVVFGVFQGEGDLPAALAFLAAVTVGNTVGGVLLVGTINYGQTHETRVPDRDAMTLQLSWKEFLVGHHVGRRSGGAVAPELDHDSART